MRAMYVTYRVNWDGGYLTVGTDAMLAPVNFPTSLVCTEVALECPSASLEKGSPGREA
jgi:hypothetical protein